MNGSASKWNELAEKHLKSASTRPRPDAIHEIWTALEADSFSDRAIAYLEDLRIFEHLLWPTYSDEASNQHVLLLAFVSHSKQRSGLPSWTLYADRTDDFSSLCRRILSLSLDTSLSVVSRLALLNFVISAFQSLEHDFVRKEFAPLVSIATWHNLHDEAARNRAVEKTSARKKAWKLAQKRFDAASPQDQARIKFERSWLYATLLDFLQRADSDKFSTSDITYGERFLELLCDLTSQLPTRRYTNTLIKDLNLLPVLRRSGLYERPSHGSIRALASLFEHFQGFAVDEADISEPSSRAMLSAHHAALADLQRIAYEHFESKLKVLAMSNYGSIDTPEELQQSLGPLTDEELQKLCGLLGFRTSYPAGVSIPTGRSLWLQILLDAYARPKDSRQLMNALCVSPTEATLYNSNLLQHDTYDGTRPLDLPKLNLQYLSLTDFMWRSFLLHQAESFHGIRKDLESIVKRMKPKLGQKSGDILFDGFSKMAMPIEKPAIVEISPPKVGSNHPGLVRSEVIIDVSRLTESMRAEWDSLRTHDTVFLMAVRPAAESNGVKDSKKEKNALGIELLRTAELVQILDDDNKPIRETANGYASRSRRRHLLLDIDPVAFQADRDAGKSDIYNNINVIARRKGRENNFKPVLETIQKLANAQTTLPDWLQEVFLGYGDPTSATYSQLESKIQSIDYLDTFLNWEHLKESFANRELAGSGDESLFSPPYVLETFATTSSEPASNPKKRRRDQIEEDSGDSRAPVRVKTYQPPNTGPYPIDQPKKNSVRFMPTQVEAIVSGSQPGLTVIVGPPGTGKTDVATQIMNVLYHNFPSERILLIAHSNQALNQLFQKITALDIDPRHLLRLGHGESELETEASYTKAGRVESLLENRQVHLQEVARLAASIHAEGAHGSSCETADYFNQVFVKPAWTQFWGNANSESSTAKTIAAAFPFHAFFSNAPIPALFPESASREEALSVASGCEYHLNKLFMDLEAIRPFEILRHPRDQNNHLLVKEARIIAMTSTHAAINATEIASLGFHYDTLIMEEAAQITEIESFIPLALQNPSPTSGALPLKRLVLVGDHLQNDPIIQDLALKQYSNYNQSLFLRLVRLGVPTITLNAQGRCRPSLATLFQFRYPTLTNLPLTSTQPEFLHANAGLRYDYQFIDTSTSEGALEREPTPHFIQNLPEAEYAVALYQYMRLLGYPAGSISILTTYAGQRALIRDVLEHRCKNNALFRLPKIVATVDKYQGEQNDYVILSLVRTKAVGYLRDVKRLTVALSRARLGLYILGNWDLFSSCPEMAPVMDLLGKRSRKLSVVTGEMWGQTTREASAEVEATEIENLEHLGTYVYQMTEAKVKALGGRVANQAAEDSVAIVEEIEDDGDEDDGVQGDM
ncbi:Intron-binding protein aquarius [Cyphellophora attinorum]|uniref:Pre-mRNA-splicing factor n=1 Tax=Cyphellophora attinorum TaxID=1664694 RepID=A0A0N1H8N5_9EURO|nr:Intron-binding protein aquarius [Phialophora attinorum]KPI39753.1 Intron-binding protein aquarius [Phialophora attinorum]